MKNFDKYKREKQRAEEWQTWILLAIVVGFAAYSILAAFDAGAEPKETITGVHPMLPGDLPKTTVSSSPFAETIRYEPAEVIIKDPYSRQQARCFMNSINLHWDPRSQGWHAYIHCMGDTKIEPYNPTAAERRAIKEAVFK